MNAMHLDSPPAYVQSASPSRPVSIVNRVSVRRASAVISTGLQRNEPDRMLTEPGSTVTLGAQSSNVCSRSATILSWNKKNEERFDELAARKALGTLTTAQRDEFRKLRRIRDCVVAPMSASDIRRELELDRVVNALSAAYEQYVKFHEAENKAP